MCVIGYTLKIPYLQPWTKYFEQKEISKIEQEQKTSISAFA